MGIRNGSSIRLRGGSAAKTAIFSSVPELPFSKNQLLPLLRADKISLDGHVLLGLVLLEHSNIWDHLEKMAEKFTLDTLGFATVVSSQPAERIINHFPPVAGRNVDTTQFQSYTGANLIPGNVRVLLSALEKEGYSIANPDGFPPGLRRTFDEGKFKLEYGGSVMGSGDFRFVRPRGEVWKRVDRAHVEALEITIWEHLHGAFHNEVRRLVGEAVENIVAIDDKALAGLISRIVEKRENVQLDSAGRLQLGRLELSEQDFSWLLQQMGRS